MLRGYSMDQSPCEGLRFEKNLKLTESRKLMFFFKQFQLG
jgi:hypothetical protein